MNISKINSKKWQIDGTDETFKTKKAAQARVEEIEAQQAQATEALAPAKVKHLRHVEIGGTTYPVLYETEKNRATASHTAVLDLRGMDVNALGTKYALACLTHGTLAPATKRLPAEELSHRSAEWCPQCDGKHVPPAKGEVTLVGDDVALATYRYVLVNWAVGTGDALKALSDHDSREVRNALTKMEREGILHSSHVNGEHELTWQTNYDVQNDDDAMSKGAEEFAQAYGMKVAHVTKALSA